MGLTNFPNGVTSFGLPLIGSGPILTTGTIRFLSSSTTGSSDGNLGTDPARPLATLERATALATANVGDYVIIMPNHAETITGVGGLTFNKAGVTYVGLGHGKQKPRFLMDGATTVSALITAADVTLHNFEFASGTSDTVVGIDISATDVWLDGIVFTDNAANENWLTPIKCTGTSDNAEDGLKITNCEYKTEDVGALEFIEVNADVARMELVGNKVLTGLSTAAKLLLVVAGKSIQSIYAADNVVDSATTSGELLIEGNQTDNTGMVLRNAISHLDVIGAHLMTGLDGVGHIENYSTSVVTLSGVIVPNIDVNL